MNSLIKKFLSLFPDSYLVLLNDKEKDSKIERLKNNLDLNKAKRFNNIGYGVFFTPNGHKGGFKETNLTKINAWFIDTDKGTKKKQLAQIENSPIKPSVIVETRRGYHVYWLAKDATKANYSTIQTSLVNYFNADHNTKSIDKLLRVPFFNHNKKQPFKVKLLQLHSTITYYEKQMLEAFYIEEPEIIIQKPEIKEKKPYRGNNSIYKGLAEAYPEEFSHGIDKANSKRHLKVLSGSSFVNYETYTFKSNRDGTYQIIVNGKAISCWIRKDGSIGSYTDGSPSIIQWIKWFEKHG